MANVKPLMERNFIEYASYVIVDRAIPDIRDGFKPVQRRIMYTLHQMDDGKFNKVANAIGETMKLHPHGDVSIGDALVVLANKEYFIEKQGNFGNPLSGHGAAAPRYIECRLTDLARETLFSKALTELQPSYDGRRQEPVFLPAKLPVALMIGAEGIAVGLATKILPHNLKELLKAQIGILKHRPTKVYPDFYTGGILDVSEYDDGRGKIKVRARIDRKDDKTIVIREIPHSTNTEKLIASIEAATQKGKLKIQSINDFTTDKAEIEIELPRGVYADEVIPQLYAYTECEVSISSNIVVIKDRTPVEMTVSEILKFLTDQLRDQICRELEFELGQLKEKRRWLSLEALFIEKKIYKRIEKAASQEQIKQEVYAGLKPFAEELASSVTDDDIRKLLEIPIRRISKYDIDKNRREIEDIDINISRIESRIASLTKTTIEYLEGLLEKYGERYPRRSEIQSFESVDVKTVARQNIKLGYDPENGFFGSEVKGTELNLTASEYDRILVVCQDGSYRIVGPEKKMLIPSKALYMEMFDQEKGKSFIVVYIAGNKLAFAKKVHIRRFVRDKEYELIKGKDGKVALLLPGDAQGTVQLDFAPAKRQRIKQAFFNLGDLKEVGISARGVRMASKAVSKVKLVEDRG